MLPDVLGEKIGVSIARQYVKGVHILALDLVFYSDVSYNWWYKEMGGLCWLAGRTSRDAIPELEMAAGYLKLKTSCKLPKSYPDPNCVCDTLVEAGYYAISVLLDWAREYPNAKHDV